MIENETIRLCLYSIFGDRLPLIEADQNGTPPEKDFATYKFLYSVGSGMDEPKAVQDDGFREVHGNRVGHIEVNFYGQKSIAFAHELYDRLGAETTVDLFTTYGLQINTRQNPMNISKKENNQNERRAMIEFSCIYKSIISEETQYIESVEINSEVHGSNIYNNTFTASP